MSRGKRIQRRSDKVDLCREGYVDLGDAAAVVGCQLHLGVAPAECDVGVMISRLGEGSDSVYERKRLGKILKRPTPLDAVTVNRPSIQPG